MAMTRKDAYVRNLLKITQVHVDTKNGTAEIGHWYDQDAVKMKRLGSGKTSCRVIEQTTEAGDAIMTRCNVLMVNDGRADE